LLIKKKKSDLSGNIDIRGKTLTVPNLYLCYYNLENNKTKYGICLSKDASCEPPYVTDIYEYPEC